MSLSRRNFLKIAGVASAGVLAGIGLSKLQKPPVGSLLPDEPVKTNLGEVMFYEKLSDKRIKCEVCPRLCIVSPGNRGFCRNKENQDGRYYSLVYGQAASCNTKDMIEKKPFFHFLPGSRTFSFATTGCNIECQNCQNWDISQARPEDRTTDHWPPQKIVEFCQSDRIPVIAFTYTEPVVFYEYMYDTAKLAREKGIASVMVSNGYINEKPLRKLCEQLSAVKIDLKSFSPDFYRKICNGELPPVLNTLLTLKKTGIWFEIVVLIIPTLNDGAEELTRMCAWIKDNLGTEVPLHFSRFTPQYKLTNLPSTPLVTLENAYEIARQSGLKYVYLGNVTPHPAESTYCPNCQKLLIKRESFYIKIVDLENGKCHNCQRVIPGIWRK